MSAIVVVYWSVFVLLTLWTLWSGATGRWSSGYDDWTWMWVLWLIWPLFVFVIPVELRDWWREREDRP